MLPTVCPRVCSPENYFLQINPEAGLRIAMLIAAMITSAHRMLNQTRLQIESFCTIG
jgi:hypothetical protein